VLRVARSGREALAVVHTFTEPLAQTITIPLPDVARHVVGSFHAGEQEPMICGGRLIVPLRGEFRASVVHLVRGIIVEIKMSLFLTNAEAGRIESQPGDSSASALLSAMEARVRLRASGPGLSDASATTDWWHHAAEYLTDAALVQRHPAFA